MNKLLNFIYYLIFTMVMGAIYFTSLVMIIDLREYYFLFNIGLVLNIFAAYGLITVLTNPGWWGKE